MSVNSADDLRNLLRHSMYEVPPYPERANDSSPSVDIPVLGELASLIDSLDFGSTATVSNLFSLWYTSFVVRKRYSRHTHVIFLLLK